MRKETSRVKFLVILIDIYPTKIPVSDWSKTPGYFFRNQLQLSKIVKLSVDGRGWGWVLLSKLQCNDTTIPASLFQILAALSAKAIYESSKIISMSQLSVSEFSAELHARAKRARVVPQSEENLVRVTYPSRKFW